MTKLDPITSEEVLERQVKEQARLRPVPSVQNREVSTVPAEANTGANPSTLPEGASNTASERADAGYIYRLPLGSYLLSFLYLQIFVIVAFSIIITAALSIQSDHTVGQSILSIQRETWGVLVVSIVFSFFIFSGNNILRLLTIGGSSLLVLLLGYQLIHSLLTLVQSSELFPFISLFTAPYVLIFMLGIFLSIVTIMYLLRRKVSNAYN